MSEMKGFVKVAAAAREMNRALENVAASFADFNSTYRRSIEIEKWQKRSTRFSLPRWRRWVARYVTWCLRRDGKRASYMRKVRNPHV